MLQFSTSSLLHFLHFHPHYHLLWIVVRVCFEMGVEVNVEDEAEEVNVER